MASTNPPATSRLTTPPAHATLTPTQMLAVLDADPKVVEEFAKLNSDQDRITFIIQKYDSIIPAPDNPLFDTKSPRMADGFRQQGNEYFKTRQFQKALEMYTRSVFFSPFHTRKGASGETRENVELSLGLAYRSVVLFQVGKFNEALEDINEAFAHGYPKQLQFKLYERRAKCLLRLGKIPEAKESIHHTIVAFHQSGCEGGLIDQTVQSLQDDVAKYSSKFKCVKPENGLVTEPEAISLGQGVKLDGKIHKFHPKYKSASAKEDIAYTPEKGRHGICTDDIALGEHITIEKPFCAIMFPNQATLHCNHCFKRSYNLIPCRRCSCLGYCSTACGEKAWGQYHMIECAISKYLDLDHLTKTTRLAFRIVVSTSLEDIKVVASQNMEQPLMMNGKRAESTSQGLQDYLAIKSLVSNNSVRESKEQLLFAGLSLYLTKALKNTPYFQKFSAARNIGRLDPDNDDMLVTCLFYHLFGVIDCNALEITEVTVSGPRPDFRHAKTQDIGFGLYPTVALLNHSCMPNASLVFYQNECVVVAIRNIKKGEEITIDYGPVYYLHLSTRRQLELNRKYYFDCKCEPCVNNWPISEKLDAKQPMFKCSQCGHRQKGFTPRNATVQCSTCNAIAKPFEVLQALKLSHQSYTNAIETIGTTVNQKDVNNLITILESHMGLMDQWMMQPWKDYIVCQSLLRQSYKVKGNFSYLDRVC